MVFAHGYARERSRKGTQSYTCPPYFLAAILFTFTFYESSMHFILTCLFAAIVMTSVSAAQMRDTAAIPPVHAPTQPRVWLTVEVLEKKPSLGNKSSAFNEFIPVVIVDSATNAYLYALSGEMVEIGKQRTYFVSVVSGEDKSFLIEGSPVQVVRTGEPQKDDLIYQREFVIRASMPADTAASIPENIVAEAPLPKPLLKPDAATISYKADEQRPCPYIIQFCALSLEKDALQIRDALRKASANDQRLADARVEPFFEKIRNIQYQRVRAGCFATISEAKQAMDTFTKTAQRLKLGVVPIVVKNE